MIDREKVMMGLECCSHTNCVQKDCPYYHNVLDDAATGYECTTELICNALELLREQPEPKYGHWVFDPDGMDWNIPAWKCSECHCKNDNIPPNLEKTHPLRWSGSKFCPNCGAKMDEKVMQDA